MWKARMCVQKAESVYFAEGMGSLNYIQKPFKLSET
jgi:hypothetical protein